MFSLSYYSMLKELDLHLDSLALNRLRVDLLTVYKILFGLLNTSIEAFFTLSSEYPRVLTWSLTHGR